MTSYMYSDRLTSKQPSSYPACMLAKINPERFRLPGLAAGLKLSGALGKIFFTGLEKHFGVEKKTSGCGILVRFGG